MTIKARVHRGRLVVDEPTSLPEGTEVESAVRILALLPGAGTRYTHADTPDLRRLYLRKLDCHLYYTSMMMK